MGQLQDLARTEAVKKTHSYMKLCEITLEQEMFY